MGYSHIPKKNLSDSMGRGAESSREVEGAGRHSDIDTNTSRKTMMDEIVIFILEIFQKLLILVFEVYICCMYAVHMVGRLL